MIHPLRELVSSICGPLSDEEAAHVLLAASSYPFGDSESIRKTLTESWTNGGKTVDGAIGWAHDDLDRDWEAGRKERERGRT